MAKSDIGIPIIQQMGAEVLERTDHSIKVKMPLEPNINHVGIMYAGSLFTLAEFPVGELLVPQIDPSKAFLVVGKATIKYIKPAMTDITADFQFEEGIADKLCAEVEEKGKFSMLHQQELVDEAGDVVAITEIQYVGIKPYKL